MRISFQRSTLMAITAITAVSFVVAPVADALSKSDYAGQDIIIYDPDGSVNGECPTGGPASSAEVNAFASIPVSSTWNITDSAAEQWFLKQTSARATIGKYGLNSSNIPDISKAVREQGVSPVFFYLYTVNEGGGAGGFINHYGSDTSGGGVGNATRDAKYIAEYSKKMDTKPAWIDAGNPVDFVPQSAKDAGEKNFKNMPSGALGRTYIPATAAATWEAYYPNGLKKTYNKIQNYGPPLADAMKNVKSMGGNPTEGGSSVANGGCANNIVGEGMAKGISFAKAIAENDGYGYDQSTRGTGWITWQKNPNCIGSCGSFDCSSFISAILTVAGFYQKNPNFTTAIQADALRGIGFTEVSSRDPADLLPGDILLRKGHTEMYFGDGKRVGAHHGDAGHGISGGKKGDQKGDEISIVPYNQARDRWTSIWRAPAQ